MVTGVEAPDVIVAGAHARHPHLGPGRLHGHRQSGRAVGDDQRAGLVEQRHLDVVGARRGDRPVGEAPVPGEVVAFGRMRAHEDVVGDLPDLVAVAIDDVDAHVVRAVLQVEGDLHPLVVRGHELALAVTPQAHLPVHRVDHVRHRRRATLDQRRGHLEVLGDEEGRHGGDDQRDEGRHRRSAHSGTTATLGTSKV